MSTFRIGIDCRLSGNTHAGIGRYIENLITRLPLDKGIEWVLFFSNQKQVPSQAAFEKAIQEHKISVNFVAVRHYTLAEQLKLPKIFADQKLDLLHVPHFNVPLGLKENQKLIVTIHDLLWHEQKGLHVTTLSPWKYWLKYLGYKAVTSSAISRAKTILVPSIAVKNILKKYYSHADAKVVVTYEGADQYQSKKIHKSEKNSNTLLYVGSLYPHKNIVVVLKALQHNKNIRLEIAGSRNVFQENVRHQAQMLGVANQVSFLGYVADDQLLEKYQTSLALIQPSLSEGFGLTGLEAMSAGGNVLASSIPVFKEIYQDGAYYFDPRDPSDLSEAITRLQQQSSKEAQQMSQKSLEISKQYSWQTMVDQTVSEYLKLL